MRTVIASLFALGAVAVVTAVTVALLPMVGLASAALLFLLPVLTASVRGGVVPGLIAAGAGALAYNFFLLPPRFTLHVHGIDNLISVVMLFAVAYVTSHLATALKAREVEARARAAASAEAAELATLLARSDGLARGLELLGKRYGTTVILSHGSREEELQGLSPLDQSAAGWAMHNGDATGHGTAAMAAAEWSFLPLAMQRDQPGDVLAIARPADGATRSDGEIAHLRALAGLIAQARDREALAEERRLRDRLEDRDTLRRALLASVAHDFRTPLTVIAGELAPLAATAPAAARALTAAQRLERMMDDLMGAARIESGAVAAVREAVDLVDVVDQACIAVPLPKGIMLTRTLAADLPMVSADPVLLRHIIVNLIDNAARHANSAIVIVAEAGDGSVSLAVEDDGPGIPPGDRERIFDRFTRIEGDDCSGGSGLGLAIVRGFADVMNMGIAVEDRPGGGSRFILTMTARTVTMP
jgi:two-component system sensor histidine kinase KdpD